MMKKHLQGDGYCQRGLLLLSRTKNNCMQKKRVVFIVIGGVLLAVLGGAYLRELQARYHYKSQYQWKEVVPFVNEDGTQTVNIEKKIYPWEKEVAPCIIDYAGYTVLLDSRCPKCGRRKKKIFFKTPQWTWGCLCGRAGWMTICDHCKLQFEFDCVFMN